MAPLGRLQANTKEAGLDAKMTETFLINAKMTCFQLLGWT
jgi:hypothetical protein